PDLVGRRELEQPAHCTATAVLEYPNRPVWTLLNGADAHAHVEALDFASLVAVDLDATDELPRQTAHESVAAPFRERIAGVEHQTRRRYRLAGIGVPEPEDRRRLELGPRVVIRNRPAAVVDAFRHDRPTVIRAALDVIQLVPALRGHLDVPKVTCRIEREPKRIAMSERPDLGGDAALIGERVVVGHRSVHVEPDDLAHRRLHVLGRRALLAFAGADPEVTAAEGD